MKYRLFALLFVCFFKGYSQQTPIFNLLRYDDDFSYLKNDTSKSWYSKLKYQPLSSDGNAYISFGGDFRYQYFYLRNERWGEFATVDWFLYARHIVHADLHLNQKLRMFVQLQSSIAPGKNNKSPVDQNTLDLQQAFIEYHSSGDVSQKLLLRFGRQELNYGSQRLVSVSEGPNNRQIFDAFKFQYAAKNLVTDLFYSHHLQDRKGVFDDRYDKNNRFFGSYTVLSDIPVFQNVDLYYFGLNKKRAVFDEAVGKENRHTIGTRVSGKTSSWRYDVEGDFQFGRFGGKRISAWQFSSNAGYKLNRLKFQPEIGLKTDVISGDEHAGDNLHRSFNPLFNRGGYFGLAALVSPVNLIDIHPSLKFELIKKKLATQIGYTAFWRYSKNDGFYGPGVSLLYSGNNTTNKFIGDQVVWQMTFSPNAFLYISPEFTWFRPGAYLKEVGPGKNLVYTGLTTQLKF